MVSQGCKFWQTGCTKQNLYVVHTRDACCSRCNYQLVVLQQLEQQLQQQQGEQESQQATEPQKLTQAAVGRRCSTSAISQSNTSADLPDQDNSVAEGAAGLLAMTSTADRTQATQVSCSCCSSLRCSSSCFAPSVSFPGGILQLLQA